MHVRLHCHVDIQMAVGVAFTALPFVLLLAQITECTSAACKKSPIILSEFASTEKIVHIIIYIYIINRGDCIF